MANVGKRDDTRQGRTEELLQSQIAWNVSTTAFYKSGARPWKVSGIRESVAYIGLVFKRHSKTGEERSCACGAQMFLDSGDGVVFKGAVGNWYNSTSEEYHLDEVAAKALVKMAVDAYKKKHDDQPPKELFIHGQTRFNRVEWDGLPQQSILVRAWSESAFATTNSSSSFERRTTPCSVASHTLIARVRRSSGLAAGLLVLGPIREWRFRIL